MRLVTAPENIHPDEEKGLLSIFLGGSIEMGIAENWQKRLIDTLSEKPYADKLMVFNPRRPDWDSSWSQDPYEAPFREQVTWELKHQTMADLLVYYFCAQTVSPITLLEFGVFHDRQPVVGLHRDYGRYGNMVLTCEYLNVPFKREWDNFVSALDMRIVNMLAEKE